MADANHPDGLLYHEAHDWAQVEDGVARFGITWHAQDQLGDVVFFNPPEVGAAIVAGGSYGEVESVKAVSDLVSPLDGEVVEVNAEVVETPELVNTDPYAAWLVKVRLTAPEQVEGLLSADEYRTLVE
jgi:glycine cleavage system H protein